MKTIFSLKIIRILVAIFCTLIYFSFATLMIFTEIIEKIPSKKVVFQLIFLCGFIPWTFWVFFLLFKPKIRFFVYAILSVLFHYCVAAFTFHSDSYPLTYFLLQTIEISLLIPLWFTYNKLKREAPLN
jgi:hypothetical protein